MTEIHIRPAEPGDLPALTGLLVRAFAQDEFITWVYLDPPSRPRVHGGLTAEALRRQYLPGGGVQVALDEQDRLLGGGVWAPPGPAHGGRWHKLLLIPAILTAMGPGNFREFLRRGKAVDHALAAARPAEPHWYLSLLAADPDRQRSGVGGALLRARLTGLRAPAYLECVRDNVGYYERFGFTVTEKLDLPPAAPPLFGMWREPS
ncbi:MULTISPECIES: GNAT family N-acetyltransferase [unclassified Crossiella]|uniref:GNAT family N-acetyltransferase n=1 Tax=unclassified Crossiella TaxID=2620835 RepID=UPI001FFEAC86|nr:MULTISPECIES: GNAT family N-acetyltransferase [unclassified Crossiella]MCK2238721.1 GNAT family N-acetyltransferase [Crossiella sp. S99.2]MCK2251709.1 GNAT family N-acetyltransferase [Crossiella sp. S99.1]